MPPLAYEVKHHPGSVNNLLVQQLIHRQVVEERPIEATLSLECDARPKLSLLAYIPVLVVLSETVGHDICLRFLR